MKKYLIACNDACDTFEQLQRMYLKMKPDLGEKVTYSKNSMTISTNYFIIYFISKYNLDGKNKCSFYGIKGTNLFKRFAGKKERRAYDDLVEKNRKQYLSNDGDGLLNMYFREGK